MRDASPELKASSHCLKTARVGVSDMGAAVRDAANRRRLKTEGARLNILLD
jgi:hypothetical protein